MQRSPILQTIEVFLAGKPDLKPEGKLPLANVTRIFQDLTRKVLETSFPDCAAEQARDFQKFKEAWDVVTNPKSKLLPITAKTLPKIIDAFTPALEECHRGVQHLVDANKNELCRLFGIEKNEWPAYRAEFIKSYIFSIERQLLDNANQVFAAHQNKPEYDMLKDLVLIVGFVAKGNNTVEFFERQNATRGIDAADWGGGDSKAESKRTSGIFQKLGKKAPTKEDQKQTAVMEDLKANPNAQPALLRCGIVKPVKSAPAKMKTAQEEAQASPSPARPPERGSTSAPELKEDSELKSPRPRRNSTGE